MEESEDRLHEEIDKYEKMRTEYQKAVREREGIQKARELEHLQETERNDTLSKELDELRYKFQIVQKQRSNTTYLGGGPNGEDGPGAAAIRELEAEIRQLRIDNNQLTNQMEEMKAHAIKNDLDNGRLLLHLTSSNAPSLAAEMDFMSKDEVILKINSEI